MIPNPFKNPLSIKFFKMAKAHKTRDNINTPGVAQNRYDILKEVISRYKDAMKNGYYLEAVALCESLITDRMESRYGELTKVDPEFNTLSGLRNLLNGNKNQPKVETDPTLENIYNLICNTWASERNKAVHQAAKISKASPKVWSAFLSDAKKAAEDGMKYFRELDKQLKKLR